MDFTGMSDYAIDAVVGMNIFNSIIGLFMFFICIILFINFFKWLGSLDEPRKAKKYRQFRADMYVAAKIDKLAKKEQLSLEKENLKFLIWCKKEKNQKLSLDDAIEAELKDAIVKEKLNEETKE